MGHSRIRMCAVVGERLVRDLFRTLFDQQADIDLVELSDAVADAADFCRGHQVDVVLLHSAGSNPFRVLELEPFQHLEAPPKVVVMAPSVSEEEAVAWREAGVVGILQTSCSSELLLRCIRKVAAGEFWFSQEILRFLLSPRHVHHPVRNGCGKPLTQREQRVLDLVVEGLTNKEIAAEIGISDTAVKATLQAIFHKQGVRSRSQLVRIALENQLSAVTVNGHP